ncbi:MAG TPA: hypothetical protein VF089_19630, partial [Candidatus Binatia bacterium]
SFADLATAAGNDHGFVFEAHDRILLWEIMKDESRKLKRMLARRDCEDGNLNKYFLMRLISVFSFHHLALTNVVLPLTPPHRPVNEPAVSLT